MPEYLAPGVFVEEIDSGSKPIEGVGINTAAFIGYAKSGDYNKPTFITNWSQFSQIFGEEENALTTALVKELKTTVADVRAAKKASRKSWMEYANQAIIQGITAKKTTVTSWQDFLRAYQIPQGSLPYRDGAYLAHAVRGYYDNGGGRAYIIRVAHPDDIAALSYKLDGVGAAPVETKIGAAKPAQVTVGPYLLTASKPGAAGNDIKVEVEHVGDGNEFKIKISQGDLTELFPESGKPLTPDTAAQALGKSKLVKVEVAPKVALERPEPKLFVMAEGIDPANLPVASTTTALAASGSPFTNGLANLKADDFIGDEAQRTGIGGLMPLEGVNFVAIPDLMAGLFQRVETPGGVGAEVTVFDEAKKQSILDAQCALVAHCERVGYRMAILDPIPGLTPLEMNSTTMGTAYNCDHGQGAIYYPWIKISDPVRRGQQMFCPPSGHIAGVWARVGVERGVHKAPANEALMGAVGLEVEVTKGEQELLNPNGINCIRAFSGRGIRVWGARTLATVGNPSWKYVNVRRLFNYLEESMERSMQWVVFEPNDQDLWGRVRRNISAFLFTEWKEGKLFGSVPQEAFYVKCDSETNPQEMIDLGRLYVEIGVNPVKPAEFVIIRMGQWSDGGSLAEV
ncbi:MAG: phage tail protein [Capsulimonas sp.]|nr:phage tail protein [Capsulimonas sp.]